MRILWSALANCCVLIRCHLPHLSSAPVPFLQCKASITPGGSGVLADLARIDQEFRQAWLPFFCWSGRGEPSKKEFSDEVGGWLPILDEVSVSVLGMRFLLKWSVVRVPFLVVLTGGVGER